MVENQPRLLKLLLIDIREQASSDVNEAKAFIILNVWRRTTLQRLNKQRGLQTNLILCSLGLKNTTHWILKKHYQMWFFDATSL